MGLQPDGGFNPLLICVSRDGRVLWRVNTATLIRGIAISDSEVHALEVAFNGREIAYERFDRKSGKNAARGTWTLPVGQLAGLKVVSMDASGGLSVIGWTELAKLTSAGRMLWKVSIGNTGPSVLYSDAMDNHYVAGHYATGQGTGASIAKYGPDGVLLWFKEVIRCKWPEVAIIDDVAGTGETVFVLGTRVRPVDASPHTSFDSLDFIAKLSHSGTVEWRQILKGDTYSSVITRLAVDRSGNAYVAEDGPWSGKRVALSKLDSDGRLKWKAVSPSRPLLLLIIAVLVLAVQLIKTRREKRAAQEQLSHP